MWCGENNNPGCYIWYNSQLSYENFQLPRTKLHKQRIPRRLEGLGYNVPRRALTDQRLKAIREFQQRYNKVDGVAGGTTQEVAADLVKNLQGV